MAAVGVGDFQIVFDLKGKTKTLDSNKINAVTWDALEASTDYTPGTFLEKLFASSIRAIVSLIWLEQRQVDREVKWSRVAKQVEVLGSEDLEVHCLYVDGELTMGDAPDGYELPGSKSKKTKGKDRGLDPSGESS